ncbi:hypothetical protein PGB90_003564 [Kerria lacca]
MSSIWTRAAHSVVASGPVTVTSINVQNISNSNDQNITTISKAEDFSVKKESDMPENNGEDMSDSEGELSKIDFAGVTMRNKKSKSEEVPNDRVERPMSWEGELSDSDMKQENYNGDTSVTMSENDSSNSRIENTDNNDDIKPTPLKFTTEFNVEQMTDNVKVSNATSHSEIPLLVDKLLGINGSNVYSVNRHNLIEDNSHMDNGLVDHTDENNVYEDRVPPFTGEMGHHSPNLGTSSGISRQQLINSPCPICGDKISGFHYGIFSCESCKGFFKRTVQNHKNYVCLRGSSCLVTIATRKKCPACRFDKCLNMGMKLEAIRVDRTRGGRSTYPFSYTLPASITQMHNSNDSSVNIVKQEVSDTSSLSPLMSNRLIPPLLQEIMEVEHLWQYNENETPNIKTNANNPDFLANLCNIADHRLYKIVKWCKSLPLFKNISIDDQISLLINAWCELLLFSCCYRSVGSPGEIRVSLGKSITLNQARELGLAPCIERMLNFTEHLRRLRVDRYEYVAMKVIVLLSSDSSDLREPEKARASQEKALQALQQYTIAHYPDMPSKFGELLLRIPDLQRTCQVGKEMLSIKHKEGEGPSFNLLMELLRGDH